MLLFVYGSLKAGECNYAQLRPWVRSVRPARGPGQLYLRPDGYPALCLEPHQWLALGTRDYAGDALLSRPQGGAPAGAVAGELLELSEPLLALPHLDSFEGYWADHDSDYWRVLIPCWLPDSSAGVAAWTYVCRPEQLDGWQPIEQWPPAGREQPAPYQSGRFKRGL